MRINWPNLILAMAAIGAVPSEASASPFELTYTGTFTTADALNLSSASTPTTFAGLTSYTIHAFFDTSSGSVLPPAPVFSGFTAYVPTLATLDVGGKVYTIATGSASGVTVAIFDATNNFNPGLYGVGLIANPSADGAGIVGDFSGATPFSAGNLTSTVFTNFNGVGVTSGVCTNGGGANCLAHAIQPWTLTDSSNASYSLTLGSYDALASTSINTASIAAINAPVPEPATAALALAGLAAVGLKARARRRG